MYHTENTNRKEKMKNNKLKHVTKFERSGSQRSRAHSPHYVVATTHDLMGWPFFDKKEASSWAASNIKEYFEIHKDWFVE